MKTAMSISDQSSEKRVVRRQRREPLAASEKHGDLSPAVDVIDTLIVSDVHVGSNVSRADELYRLLKEYSLSDHKYRFRRLLLLGDMFDDMNFKRLREYEWKLLGLIRKMTDEDSNARVVWLRGNHDLELINLMAHLVGTKVLEEYHWQVAGKRFLAMHGDQFDRWIVNYPLLVDIPL
jgi:UDP-2,3-diacylglucosamine pyrophosphatase LpxH